MTQNLTQNQTQSKTVVNTHRLIWLLLIGVLLLYLVADFASQTLALDGLVYANIAKLLSQGEGTFWLLPYYETQVPWFSDHPPLGIYIQSLWMGLVGSAVWVEKAFSLIVFGLVMPMMVRLFNANAPSNTAEKTAVAAWPIVLLFCFIPLVTYTLKNNYLEGLLSFTCLAAVYCFLRAWTQLGYAAVAGGLVCCAVLIKGPVGLFPLATPLALWWLHGHGAFTRALTIGCVALACATVIFLLLLQDPDALTFWQTYWHNQVLASITGQRTIEHGRMYLLQQLVFCLAPLVVLVLLLSKGRPQFNRHTVMWLVIALAATLPLMISARQYRYYLLPALPFYTLAAMSMLPTINQFPNWLHKTVMLAVPLPWVYVVFILFTQWQQPGDHRQKIFHAEQLADLVPKQAALFYCPAQPTYQLRAYLFRHHQRKTTLLNNVPGEPEWVLCDKPPSEKYRIKLNLSETLNLWHKAPILQK